MTCGSFFDEPPVCTHNSDGEHRCDYPRDGHAEMHECDCGVSW